MKTTAKQKAHTPRNIHKEITDSIIAAIEAGTDKWQMPWHRACLTRPINASTKNPYRGINVITLWASALQQDFTSDYWGSYKQFQALGGQVRKGERATRIVFYKTFARADEEADNIITDDDIKSDDRRRAFLRYSPVFNADQIDEWEAPDMKEAPTIDPIASVEAFVAATSADIRIGGNDKAFYNFIDDFIAMPDKKRFTGENPQERWYSTLLHELTHWTGHKTRCARQIENDRHTEAYAFEELVAELGAAYLCADLNISNSPRDDHAQYMAGWLKSLKSDDRAIFRAAALAEKAVAFLRVPRGELDAGS